MSGEYLGSRTEDRARERDSEVSANNTEGRVHENDAYNELGVGSAARDLPSWYNQGARNVLLQRKEVHVHEAGVGEDLNTREMSAGNSRQRRGSTSVSMSMNMEYARSWTRAGLLQPQSFLSARSNLNANLSQSPSISYTSPNESSIAPRSSFSGGSRRDSNTANISSVSPLYTDTESTTSPDRAGDFFSRSPSDIRANTVELSTLPMLSVSRQTFPHDLTHASVPESLRPSQARSPPFDASFQPSERGASIAGPSYLGPYQMRTPLTSADLARLTASVVPRKSLETQREHPSEPDPIARLSPKSNFPEDHDEDLTTPSPPSATPSANAFRPTLPVPQQDRTKISNNTPISSTPSGISLLLAQQRSQSLCDTRTVDETIYPDSIRISKSAPNENRPTQHDMHSDASNRRTKTGADDDTMTRATEQTPLLSTSPAPSGSSLGPSHYFTTRPSTPTSETNNKWWPWSSGHTLPIHEPHTNDSISVSKMGKGPTSFVRKIRNSILKNTKERTSKKALEHAAAVIIRSFPAVLLGVLLNILDGLSYGMIMFPSTDIFQNFGGIGVSMFFVTAIIAQLVYSFGGSGFAGANGSMMIEVVPFFHIIAQEITQEVGEENVSQVISTTIAAFALSAVLTGFTFFMLGYLRLGVIIGFFPRHILVGCIGGVGVFLLRTGLAVSARIDDDDFSYSLGTLKFLFGNLHILGLWFIPLVLAVLLRLITHNFNHQLIFPTYFILIPVIFYIVVAAAGLDISVLRHSGWVFDMGGSSEAWYKFYSYYSWENTSVRALVATMPTQLALLFFNILHPPLNVPALAVSLDEDVDTNKELVAHGYSNILAGLFGVVPNYLVYVNTLLFYRVGGTTRISGFLLALATFVLLIVGTAPIGYIPIMLVGALIFVLGIDLVKEALWDTRHRVNKTEYLTIISIMVCMSIWDFVIGVLFGIVMCCFFFVVQNSRRRSIRVMFTGDSAISAVRRPSAQRDYIRVVARQTVVLRLQGFLFFGTITQVEEAVRALVDPNEWHQNPIRFLVIDLTVVAGVDMSAAEAFVRIQRILSARSITMVLCGFEAESPIGRALKNVGLLESSSVELFSTFNDAMEWTENAYLQAWFFSQKNEAQAFNKHPAIAFPGRSQESEYTFASTFHNSPRRAEIHAAAGEILENHFIKSSPTPGDEDANDAFAALTQAFSSYGALDRNVYKPLLNALERIDAPAGTLLWNQGDPSDGLFLIESGVLSSTYEFPNRKDTFSESMVGGTLAGELSALSGLPRNSRVVAEKDAILWKLSMEDLARLEEQHPDLMRDFLHLVLKVAKTDYDILFSALSARH